MRLGSVLLVLGAAVAVIAAGAIFGATVLVGDGGATASTPPPPLVSSALPVSRRAEPSLDRYLRTPRRTTASRAMNGAQQWLVSRARPLVAYDSDPVVSLNALGWSGNPAVDVYVNATGVNRYNAEGLRDARAWLVRKGGRQVYVEDWAMLDLRQPAARRWWLYGSDGKASCNRDRDRRSALDLLACGYRGLWVDNVLTLPAQWFKPDPGIDAGEWGRALVSLLTELRAALPAGRTFTINEHWTDLDFPYAGSPQVDPSSPFAQAAVLADQVIIEGGAIDPGLNYAGALGDQWSYRRLLAYADAMHGVGARLQWEKTSSTDLTRNASAQLGVLPSCSDRDLRRPQPAWRQGDAIWRAHVRTAAFNLASALLTGDAGDSVGDMCEYPGRGWKGYGVDLGAPLGGRTEEPGGILQRRFAKGFVAVNPGNAPVNVPVPGGGAAVNLASTADPSAPAVQASSFVVGPRTALVAVSGAG